MSSLMLRFKARPHIFAAVLIIDEMLLLHRPQMLCMSSRSTARRVVQLSLLQLPWADMQRYIDTIEVYCTS